MLIERVKNELLKEVNETEIDVTQLESYVWERNPYGVEEQLIGTSGSGDWNEEEEWQEKVRKLISRLEKDGLVEYSNLDDREIELDQETGELTREAIRWLNTLI